MATGVDGAAATAGAGVVVASDGDFVVVDLSVDSALDGVDAELEAFLLSFL